MPTYEARILTTASPQAAFEYLANFANTALWDPGVDAAIQTTPGPLGVGSKFDLRVKFLRRTRGLTYEIVEYVPDVRVTLTARSGKLVSVDVINVASTTSGTAVTYHADLSVGGPQALVNPILGMIFNRIGDRARAGMRDALAALPVASGEIR